MVMNSKGEILAMLSDSFAQFYSSACIGCYHEYIPQLCLISPRFFAGDGFRPLYFNLIILN